MVTEEMWSWEESSAVLSFPFCAKPSAAVKPRIFSLFLLPFPLAAAVVIVQLLSHVAIVSAPWTVALQASLSMGFPKQEYWSGLRFPSPGDLSNSVIKPASPALDSLLLSHQGSPHTNIQTRKYSYCFSNKIGILLCMSVYHEYFLISIHILKT